MVRLLLVTDFFLNVYYFNIVLSNDVFLICDGQYLRRVTGIKLLQKFREFVWKLEKIDTYEFIFEEINVNGLIIVGNRFLSAQLLSDRNCSL